MISHFLLGPLLYYSNNLKPTLNHRQHPIRAPTALKIPKSISSRCRPAMWCFVYISNVLLYRYCFECSRSCPRHNTPASRNTPSWASHESLGYRAWRRLLETTHLTSPARSEYPLELVTKACLRPARIVGSHTTPLQPRSPRSRTRTKPSQGFRSLRPTR